MKPYNCPSLLLRSSFQDAAQERGTQTEPRGLAELRRQISYKRLK